MDVGDDCSDSSDYGSDVPFDYHGSSRIHVVRSLRLRQRRQSQLDDLERELLLLDPDQFAVGPTLHCLGAPQSPLALLPPCPLPLPQLLRHQP